MGGPWTQEQVEYELQASQANAVPRLRQMPGYRGLLFLLDRSTGQSMAVTLWENEQALRRSEEMARQVREQTVGGGPQPALIESIDRYEVLVRDA